MEKVVKRAEITMQNTFQPQEEIHQLQSENQYRRRRKARPRQFIQNGGSLVGAEARQQAQREQQQQQQERRKLGHADHCSAVILVFLEIDASVLSDNFH